MTRLVRRAPPSVRKLIGFTILLASCTPPIASATPTGCTTDEEVVFSCKTGKKMIAVCSARGRAGSGTDLRYRFGPPAAAELELSTGSGDGSRATVTGGDLAFSGGGGAFLRFRKDVTDYVVYTAVGSQWGEQSGVVPERDGKPLRGAKCEGKVKSTIGPDLFKRAGIAHDESSFELPD